MTSSEAASAPVTLSTVAVAGRYVAAWCVMDDDCDPGHDEERGKRGEQQSAHARFETVADGGQFGHGLENRRRGDGLYSFVFCEVGAPSV